MEAPHKDGRCIRWPMRRVIHQLSKVEELVVDAFRGEAPERENDIVRSEL